MPMNRAGPDKARRQALVSDASPLGGASAAATVHVNVENSGHAAKPKSSPTLTSTGKRASQLLDRQATAWVVLLLTVLLTIGLWRHAETQFIERDWDNFLRVSEKQKNILITRMDDYEQVLRGGAALFAATGMPSREQWRAYVERLELDQTLPGILGTGVALMVPRESRDAHERSIRAEGFANYAITPPGNRDMLSSIVYIEPFTGRNLRAFGYDMFSDPIRREAMERARDTGQPALSKKVTLVQETVSGVQPGFLVYAPVYNTAQPPTSIAARRAALIGFVYSPFRSFDLMESTFNVPGQIVEVELFDGVPAPENLLYASQGAGRTARHVTDMTLDLGGHAWVARFRSSARLEASRQGTQPKLILFGGLALDLLLFSALYMNARHRRKMRESTAQLEQILNSYKSLVENIPGAVFRSPPGADLPVLQLSNGITPLTGEPPERFLSGERAYRQLIHPDDKSQVSAAIAEAIAKQSAYSIEYRIQARDGFTRWVNERGRVTADPSGQARWLDGLIFDVSERKAAEIMIRDLAFNDTLTGLPNRRLLLDRLDHELALSERTGRHGALLFIDLDNFKTINDTLGHAAGDQVLVEVSRRLVASVRESDTVARLGGDEFVVILENLGNTADEAAAEATELGSKILVVLSQPYRLGEALHNCTPSIGITTFCGHQASAGRLLRQADQAMYQAKSAGRRQLRFHTGDPAAPAG
ncbi:MAG: GGDEF domain-containing protein [Thiobacillus sp.]|nr:GGDEF domain-containing protein [Thiobacillus sp.]